MSTRGHVEGGGCELLLALVLLVTSCTYMAFCQAF